MNLIENHMEQVSQSAAAISELPFPAPKMFTNALLHTHDITALIRDTEAHERALFKPMAPEAGSIESYTRRSTYFGGSSGAGRDGPGVKASSAVGRILGGDMLERIKRSERERKSGEAKDVDIEALLAGAERLSGIYPVPGAMDRIKALRQRHTELLASIEYYESKVAEQTVLLDRVHHGRNAAETAVTASPSRRKAQQPAPAPAPPRESYSAEDFEKEESEMRELEAKRRTLEDRVVGMQKDLGGLRR